MSTSVMEADLRRMVRQHRHVLEARPAPTLYHYTDAAGLFGILTSHRLWMKADDETRDPLELRYANHVFDQAWAALADRKGLVDRMTKAEANPFWADAGHPAHGIYFVSFCEHGDTPHHWQNFAGGGRGFSVGLRFLKGAGDWTASDSRKTKLRLGPVLYDEKDQLEMVASVLRQAKRFRSQLNPTERGQAVRQVLGELLPFFKHKSFSEEKEWRMVATRAALLTSEAARIEALDGKLTVVLEARKSRKGRLPLANVTVGPRVPDGVLAHVNALLLQQKLPPLVSPSKWGIGRA